MEEEPSGFTLVVAVVTVTVDGVMVRISLRDLLPFAASKHSARVISALDVSILIFFC